MPNKEDNNRRNNTDRQASRKQRERGNTNANPKKKQTGQPKANRGRSE